MVKSCTDGSLFTKFHAWNKPKSRLKPKHVLQAYHKAGTGHNVADTTQHTRHVTAPVQGVMLYGNRLACCTKNHFMVGTLAGHSDTMNGDAVVLSAPGVVQVLFLWLVASKLLVLPQAPFSKEPL